MQVVINGFISGLQIAVLAMAFQAVYLPTRLFFVGLAGLYAATPFVFIIFQNLLENAVAAAFVTMMIVGLLAIGCEVLNHAPLSRRGASDGAHLVSSLGLYVLLSQGVAMVWGNDPRFLRSGIDDKQEFWGMTLTNSQVIAAVASITILLVFIAVLRITKIGLRLRALADNPSQFALYGHNTAWYRLAAFGLSGALCAAAALLTAYDVGFDPQTGLHAVLLAVVAVIIGGRSSFMAPIVGGLLVGLVRAEVGWHWSASWRELATFVLLAMFLFLLPKGILGQRLRIEASYQ